MFKSTRDAELSLSIPDLGKRLAVHAGPLIRAALADEEKALCGDAIYDEALGALSGIVGNELAPDKETHLRFAAVVTGAIEDPRPLTDEEVARHATETGVVMASAWVQFLALILRRQREVQLTDDLLPRRADVPAELFEALRSAIHGLVIEMDDAPLIMRGFGRDLRDKGVETLHVPHVDILAKPDGFLAAPPRH